MRFINDIIKPFYRSTRVTLVALGLLLSLFVQAQGWEQYYNYDGDNSDEEASAIIQTIDQGYLFIGRTNDGASGFQIYVVRTDVDGTILWEKDFGAPDFTDEFGYDVVERPNGGFAIVGETNQGGQFDGRDVLLILTDQFGNQEGSNIYFGSDGNDRGFGIANTQDGGFIITGSQEVNGQEDVYLIKTDGLGNLEWEAGSASTAEDIGRAVIETPDGDFIVVGSFGDNINSQILIKKYNSTGDVVYQVNSIGGPENDVAYDIIQANDGEYVIAGKIGNNSDFYIIKGTDQGTNWSTSVANSFGVPGISEEARAIIQTKDNNFVLTGFADLDAIDLQAALLKISNDCENELWTKYYGRSGLDAANDVVQTAFGGFVMAGFTTEPQTFFPQDALLIKTDKDGNKVFVNYITGKVYYEDVQCIPNGNEPGIKNWVVKAEGTSDTYYAITDEDGNYELPVPVGQFEVSVVRPNEYWLPCTPISIVNFTEPYNSLERNFGIFPGADVCTDLEVDVSTHFVEACEEAEYTISYCNHGTIDASGVSVGLVLSNNLTYISGPPISQILDSLYVFDIGNVDIGECGTFKIRVEASCNAILSETHFIKANITPDAICLPEDQNWDGSSIAVNGYCDGDSVRFEISNIGSSDMINALDYSIITEDIVMGLQEPDDPTLDAGQTHKFAVEANGTTYRLIAKQSEGHPGNSSPTIAIEGCVAGGGTDYSTGYYTQLPEDDADHFLATDCQENIPSSFDAQIKRGYPKGYGDSLKIANTTDLKYHIKFQNVGIDTAIRVVIRDTISPFLDPATVRPGASSHDYKFEVYDDGILKFTFENIMLTDSSTNEAASHGFVKYRISQKPDNDVGTLIKNGAAIFFDYQAPSVTDSICNLICGDEWTDFIITSDHQVFIPKTDIKIYPNPVSQFATFELEGESIRPPLDFKVYDVSGKLVRSERFYDTTFIFSRNALPAGLFFYQISTGNQLISTGKIITK